MSDQDDRQRSEELQRKAEDMKRRAFEEEARRLEREIEGRAREMAKQRMSQDLLEHRKNLEELENQKVRAEQMRKAQEDEVQRVLDSEKSKRQEARIKKELEQKRLEQEEKRREEERKMQEEITRQKSEEDRLRREEEKRRKDESEKKRLELDTLRREQERLRREVEKHERVEALLKTAQHFYTAGDIEHAAIEVAKALVNDPTNPDALLLEQKIKDSQGTEKSKVVEEKPVESKTQAIPAATPSIEKKKSRTIKFLVYAIIAGLIILSTIVIVQYKKKMFTTPVGIAVLPLSSATNSLEETILGSALSHEIVAEFERSKPYLPLGYASIYRLSTVGSRPEEAVFRLGYPYVLQGTIGESNDKIFLRLKLVDSSGDLLWEDDYSKPADFIHEIPHETYRHIIEVLRSASDGSSARADMGHRTVNKDAYLFYLRGIEMLPRLTAQSSLNALELFNQSIQQDGLFPDARAQAAELLIERFEQGWDTSLTGLTQARMMAETALKIDPTNGTAYCALGDLAIHDHKYAQAQQQLDSALTYLPRSGEVYLSRAMLFFRMKKYNEVVDAMAHAYELDPRNLEMLRTFGYLHQLMGTPRQGIVYHERALSVAEDSTAYLIGPIADIVVIDAGLSLSYSDRVIQACQHQLSVDSTDYATMYRLARLLQVTGNSTHATTILNRLQNMLQKKIQQTPKDGKMLAYLGLTLTRLGQFPEATGFAERALAVAPHDIELKFMVAQIYSLQMYSSKSKTIDEKKKTTAIQILRTAIASGYRLDLLTSADFFNLYEHGDLNSAMY